MPNYNEIVLELQEEIDRLTRVCQSAEKQIKKLTAAISTIQTLATDSDEPIIEPPELSEEEEVGFTDQVRAIFRANPAQSFSAPMIRDILIEHNTNLNSRIALIHAHNTLKRLVQQEEITPVQLDDRRLGYRLKVTKLSPVVDLMAALKESLAQTEGKSKDRKEKSERGR